MSHSLLQAIPSLACLILAAAAFVRATTARKPPGLKRLAVLLFAEAVWSHGSVMKIFSPGASAAAVWDAMRIVSMLAIPPAAVFFSLSMMSGARRFGRGFLLAASAAAVSLAGVFLSRIARRVMPGGSNVLNAPFEIFSFPAPPLLLVTSIVMAGILVAAAFPLAIGFRDRWPGPRFAVIMTIISSLIQAAAVILALFVPLLAVPESVAPAAFTIAGVITAAGALGSRSPAHHGAISEPASAGIHDAIIMTDVNGAVLDLNPAALALFGRRYRETVGRPLAAFSPALWALAGEHSGEEAFRAGFIPETGISAVDYELRASAMHGALGEVTGRLLVIQDVTERRRTERELRRARDDCEKRIAERTEELSRVNMELAGEIRDRAAVEAALRESEGKLRSFIAQATEGLALVDETGKVAEWNQALERITGIPRSAVIGKLFWETQFPMIPRENQAPGMMESLQGTWMDALRTGSMPSMEKPMDVTIVTASGERKVCTLTVFFMKTEKGMRIGSIVLDVTEIRSAEKALRESELRYRTLYESSGDAVYLVKNGVVIDCNQRALFMFGHKGREEVVGRLAESASPPDQDSLNPEFAAFLEAAAFGRPQAFEWRRSRTDGIVLDLEITLNRVLLEGEDIIQEIVRDISDRKRAEADLARYRDSLEDLVRTRTRELESAQAELVKRERLSALGQVAATVSHEIRNPLSTVKNALFTIRDLLGDRGGERADTALDLAERNIKRCDRIIGELLDYARKRSPELRLTDVDAWLAGVMAEQQLPSGIRMELSPGCGALADIDADRLRRAVVNVITNAVQAMEEEGSRGKTLHVSSVRSGDRIELVVTDEGIGMGPEMLARIWEPMFSTKPYGVGLGMPVIRAVMEEHGGGVEVTSEEGMGTRVALWLPVKAG